MILDYSSLEALPFASVKRGLELGVKSLCLCPLLVGNEVLGVLKVARRREVAFSSRDAEFLGQIAATIVPILHRFRTRNGPKLVRPDSEKVKQPKLASASPAHHSSRTQSASSLTADAPPSAATSVPLSAVEALIGSEPSLTAYFKASKVGFCILDADFRFLAVNDALAKINGVPAAAHLGKSVRDILGDFAEVVEPYLRKVVAEGQPLADIELSFLLPSRSDPGNLIVHYLPIKDSTGKVVQIGAVVIEITEQKKLEESLRSVSDNLRQEKKSQQVLMEVNRTLANSTDLRAVFPQVSAYLRRVFRQEYAALALREEVAGHLVHKALDFPLGKNLNVAAEIGTAKVAGGKALQQRSPLIFGRDEMQQLDPGIAASLASEGLKSLCCVPLFRPKGPLGVLVLGSTRADAFRNDDFAMLNQVAAQLAIALENASIAREVEQLKQRLKQERRYLQGEARTQSHFEEIIGESPAIMQVLGQVEIISASDVSVLILGETGTGKGLVARAVHLTSKRSGRSFVTLNCAAIPTGLLESELFGHEKGAFTGAVNQKIGRLELADGGTLFLDEIGEIPLGLQPKLLRVLQDHEFERLGGTRTIKVDLRLIAATNRDLAMSVTHKEFRSDLFYRLNVFPVRLPSLRERRQDIPLLVRYFVQKFSREMGREIETVSSETMEALTQWNWPGNVRELENFIERSVILTDGSALWAPLDEFHSETSQSPEQSLEQTEREHIIRVLRETGGTIAGSAGAARRLGLKRTTLQSKMQRLGITRKDYSGKKLE
jgi:formate hydrogenlyase transcriptional activator